MFRALTRPGKPGESSWRSCRPSTRPSWASATLRVKVLIAPSRDRKVAAAPVSSFHMTRVVPLLEACRRLLGAVSAPRDSCCWTDSWATRVAAADA